MGKLLDIFRGLTGKKKKKEIMAIMEDRKEEMDAEDAAVKAMKITEEQLGNIGVKTEEATTAVRKFIRAMAECIDVVERQNTNNWRKMHGLPMRRKPYERRRCKHDSGI